MIRFLLFTMFFSGIVTNELYSNKTVNGDFYSKECCHTIKKLKVPTKVRECTQELFVYFICNDIEKTGFLTKHKEILSSNTAVLCSDENTDLIDWDDLFIQKINDVIIVEAKNLSIWYHTKDFIGKSFDDANDFCYVGFIVMNNLFVIICFVFYEKRRRRSVKTDDSIKGGYSS